VTQDLLGGADRQDHGVFLESLAIEAQLGKEDLVETLVS